MVVLPGRWGFSEACACGDPLPVGSTEPSHLFMLPVHSCTLKYMKEDAVEMPVAEFRKELADVINAAATRGRITYVTNRGRRIAAMVPLNIAEQAEDENE